VHCNTFGHCYDAVNASSFKCIKYIKKKKSWLQILAVIMLVPQNYSSFIMEELCTVLTTPNCVMRIVFMMSNIVLWVKFSALQLGTRLTCGHGEWPKNYFR